MRVGLLIVVGCLNGLLLSAQEPEPGCAPGLTSGEDRAKHIYGVFDLDRTANFPGGLSNLNAWLEEHIQYPPQAWRDSIEGEVLVSLVVEKDGSLSRIQLCRDIGGGCGAEALRVVAQMPHWNPAQANGNPVGIWFNLPIPFRMALYDPKRDFGDRVFGTDVGQVAVSPKGDRQQLFKFLLAQERLQRRLRRKTDKIYVWISMVCEKNGSLSLTLKEPATRAQLLFFQYIQALGAWQPALKQGKPVRSYCSATVCIRPSTPAKPERNQ